ncbi:MAG: hypothetical protein K2I08_11355 [Muribaculaceae bacterium]|nr:hypothetical protein [Muribaculaceae bacterium]MDE6523061.1 hypothetical protein [Muribaculaceae bacterium]
MGTIKNIIDGIASFGKVLLLSKRPSPAGTPKDEALIIMGNGPSLRDTIANNSDILKNSKTLAVNFAANADSYFELKPDIYVLADPHFFKVGDNGLSSDPNVRRLWENIAGTDWNMSLYLPCKAKIPDSIKNNTHITVKRYNLTPGEGLAGPVHWLYRKGLAMPRPRNVLIASIMIALREGYRDIYIVGADHTWSRDLWVDEKNRVISVQKHFYKDNDKEFERVAQEYAGYHLHDILNSLTIAFRSYHQILAYSAKIGAKITNCTPGSFIDAFPRSDLSSLQVP